jgi:aminoglycoside 6'-N-acetyltransferase
MTAYAFRPMSVTDLPTIQRWLETPHVAQWWHDPSEQFELVSGDLDHPDMAQFIVTADAREFAYLQCYNISAWDGGFGQQPEGTRGLDQFIGEADMIGRGHGSALIRAFADQLLASGTPRSSSIPIPPTRGRSGPMRRRDFAATAWSIRRMVRRC